MMFALTSSIIIVIISIIVINDNADWRCAG